MTHSPTPPLYYSLIMTHFKLSFICKAMLSLCTVSKGSLHHDISYFHHSTITSVSKTFIPHYKYSVNCLKVLEKTILSCVDVSFVYVLSTVTEKGGDGCFGGYFQLWAHLLAGSLPAKWIQSPLFFLCRWWGSSVISKNKRQQITTTMWYFIYIFESCHINIIYLCAFKHRFWACRTNALLIDTSARGFASLFTWAPTSVALKSIWNQWHPTTCIQFRSFIFPCFMASFSLHGVKVADGEN